MAEQEGMSPKYHPNNTIRRSKLDTVESQECRGERSPFQVEDDYSIEESMLRCFHLVN
jgi:hypothetical protein